MKKTNVSSSAFGTFVFMSIVLAGGAQAADPNTTCSPGGKRFYVAYHAAKPQKFGFGYSFLCSSTTNAGTSEAGIKAMTKTISEERKAEIVILSIIPLEK
jgi:hypothetical protein